ncbi:hypothetical protein PV325_011673 [Microctonus aethiopoides]|nr:hypothetical protein PV325_011673 [Microctonus aethiopoides]
MTHCERQCKYENTQDNVTQSNPMLASFLSSFLWGTVSKALEKSNSTNVVTFRASADTCMSNVIIRLCNRRSNTLDSSLRLAIGRVTEGDFGNLIAVTVYALVSHPKKKGLESSLKSTCAKAIDILANNQNLGLDTSEKST